MEINLDYMPETLVDCMSHYVPPIKRYITCERFGYLTGWMADVGGVKK